MTMYESDEESISTPSLDEVERKLLQIVNVRVPDFEEQIKDIGYTIKHIKMTVAATQGTAQYALRILREIKSMTTKEEEGTF